MLARSGPMYNDFIVMPRSLMAAVGAAAVWPDCNSIVSRQLFHQLHHTSWAHLDNCPDAWSMLTTALPETTRGVAPVPIWSADAVVLAGPWSAQQVSRAVEIITLPSLIGKAVPTLVLPTRSDWPEVGPEERARVRMLQAAAASLSRVETRLLTASSIHASGQAKGNHTPAEAMSDEQWNVLRQILPPEPIRPRRGRVDPRWYVEGMLWHERTGRPWWQMPDQFGSVASVLKHQGQWRADGTVAALHELLLPYESQSENQKSLMPRGR
ncbi:transposase [Streptomyces sp. NPDC002746]